jgi:hypothetical protein
MFTLQHIQQSAPPVQGLRSDRLVAIESLDECQVVAGVSFMQGVVFAGGDQLFTGVLADCL